MKLIKKYFLLLHVILYTAAFAQNHNDVLRLSEPGLFGSARALGMGNAYTAVSNEYGGVLFNPAGLGLAKQINIVGSLNYYSQDNSAFLKNSSERYADDLRTSKFKMQDFGAVFPLPTKRGSMVFAFGYTTLKNFEGGYKFDGFNPGNNSMIQTLLGYDDISYSLYLTDETGDYTPINGQLNQSGDLQESGKLGSWNLSGAVEVAKGVFLGGTINIYSGDYKRDRQYYEDDFDNIYGADVLTDPDDSETADFEGFFFNDIIDWDIEGWDARIGMMYEINEMSRLGVSIKFPGSFKINESYFVDASSYFGTGLEVYLDPVIENKVSYEVTTPFEMSAGHALTVGPIIFSTDIKFIDYTQMEFDEGLAASDMSMINRDIKEIFDSVVRYNLGVELTVPQSDIKLRGGYFNMPSPYKGDPSDFNKKYITLGFGVGSNSNLGLDVAYVHGWWKTFEDNYGFDESRVMQDISVNNLVATVTYRF